MGSQSLFHHNKPDYISHIFINHLHLNWAIYSIKTQMLDIRSVESKPKVASSLILITADRKGTLLILMCYLHLLKTALWSLERVWQTKIKNVTLANKMLLTDRLVTTFRQMCRASDDKTMKKVTGGWSAHFGFFMSYWIRYSRPTWWCTRTFSKAIWFKCSIWK